MSTCYWYNSQGTHLHQTGIPCTSTANGAVATCCDEGQICLSNGICQYATANPGGSGYFTAGCTDPSFKDPACPTNCSSFINTDIVYDYTDAYWQCCGSQNGSRNCSNPAGGALSQSAPPPMNLTYIAKVQNSSFVLLQPSAVPANTVSDGASPTGASASGSSKPITNTSSGGLSAGAGIGIGLVVGLVLAALIWLLAWRFWRYRGYRLVNTTQIPYNYNHQAQFSGFGQEVGPTHAPHPLRVAEISEYSKKAAEIHGTSQVEVPDTSRSPGRAEVPA